MIGGAWARRLGTALVALSLLLLTRELMQVGPGALRLITEPWTLALTLAASVGYAVLLLLPAVAWSCALQDAREEAFVRFAAVIIYARSNILKYLPGNVFHFGGRQVMARQMGWGHWQTFRASTLEVVTMPLVASVVALASFGLSGMGFATASPLAILPDSMRLAPALLVVFMFCVAMLTAAALLRRPDRALLRLLAKMATLELCFFIGSVALLSGVGLAMEVVVPAEVPAIAAAYLASWALGFVIPGAPGGLGVREAAFVHLAATTIAMPTAVALAILARLVTTLGDMWFAFAASVGRLPGEPEQVEN